MADKTPQSRLAALCLLAEGSASHWTSGDHGNEHQALIGWLVSFKTISALIENK